MLIVLYHGVRPDHDHDSPDIRVKHVPETIFKQHLQIFQKRFHPMSLSSVVETLNGGWAFPKNGLCITFDDGYANNAEVAAPLLTQAGIPATFFVTTGFLDGTLSLWVDRFEAAFSRLPEKDYVAVIAGQRHTFARNTMELRKQSDAKFRDRLKRVSVEERERILSQLERDAGRTDLPALYHPMTWKQAAHLAENGFEIGAHSVTHPILMQCSEDQMRREIGDSKAAIERFGIPCRHFALPNGQPSDWNTNVLTAIKSNGFLSNVTTVDGFVRRGDDPFTLKRITIDTGADLAKFRLTISGYRLMLNRLRRLLPL